MRSDPYFQVGEWIELSLTKDEYLNGFYQIKNVYLQYIELRGTLTRCFVYQLFGIDDRLFHGTCFLKIFEGATQTFDELLKDLLGRTKL